MAFMVGDHNLIKNILFVNIVFIGKKVKSLKEAKIKVGGHTKNIRLK